MFVRVLDIENIVVEMPDCGFESLCDLVELHATTSADVFRTSLVMRRIEFLL